MNQVQSNESAESSQTKQRSRLRACPKHQQLGPVHDCPACNPPKAAPETKDKSAKRTRVA